jgi:uncharacterized protein (TIGR02270 family)
VNAQSAQTPIGFAPWEISALVNREVVHQHAEEAAFLWTLRNHAIGEPHYALKDLAGLDERVEAHLDGLRVAGDVGWEFCKANLGHEGPGEVFALAVLAFGAGNRDRMREALIAGCASPKLRPGLVSALGWLDYASVSQWIQKLLEAKAPLHRAVGIAAYAIHREDPGAALTLAVDDAHPVLRARALRACGELKRDDILELVRMHLQDDDEACRFWAAWSVVLLGARDGAPVLMRFVEENGAFAARALQLVLRAMGLTESRQWVSALAKQPQFARLTVMGAGIVGDPVSVPWLIKKMESPELGRLAGEAFTMITGVDLARQDLSQDAPPKTDAAEDEIEPLDYESNLPWPSAGPVAKWWKKNQQAFSKGTRHLGGRAITAQSAIEILVSGKQRLRAAAALELALLDANYMLFEVRARATLQELRLRQWTS